MAVSLRDTAFFGIGFLASLLTIASIDTLLPTPEWQIKRIILSDFVRDAVSHNIQVYVGPDTCKSEPVSVSEVQNGIAWVFRCEIKLKTGPGGTVYYNLTKSGAIIYTEGWN